MANKKILVSAIKPTGDLHLGNYFGAMMPMIKIAAESEQSYIFIADLHALTSVQNKEELREGILQVAAGYMAAGLDPKHTILFKQSDVPAHTELTWIFDCITTMPYLMRAHAFKDAEVKNQEINVGAFNYPMLMAADILLYDANIVPVGSDQKQHVEYARDTAQKFNRIFGETFTLPEAHITEGVGTVPGTDGRKMSKSYKNTIPLFAEDDEIKSITMSIVTDSKGAEEVKDPETCNVFAIHKLVSSGDELADLSNKYKEGSISYKESKELLIEKLTKLITPLREKYVGLLNDKERLLGILNADGGKARERADAKMNVVRELVGTKLY